MKLEQLEKVLEVLESSHYYTDSNDCSYCSYCLERDFAYAHEPCQHDEAIRLVKLNIMVLEAEENKEYPEGIGND